MSESAWRARLRPASFRGARFHVELGAKASGRRIAMHEFPKRDLPYAEDMGRRARRHPVTAYLVGPDYQRPRDQLEDALEKEGPGTLILPTKGAFQVVVTGYSSVERRERGGMVEFEIEFVEAGALTAARQSEATQARAGEAAGAGEQAAAAGADTRTQAQQGGNLPAFAGTGGQASPNTLSFGSARGGGTSFPPSWNSTPFSAPYTVPT